MAKDNDRVQRERAISGGWTLEGSDVEASVDDQPQEDQHDPRADVENEPVNQLSNGALVLLGLIGGIYLLYVVVWFSWANAQAYENSLVAEGSGSLGAVLQQIVFWAAPFAPALLFFSVLVLCRTSKLIKKVIWLVVGLIVLVPLPMFGGLG